MFHTFALLHMCFIQALIHEVHGITTLARPCSNKPSVFLVSKTIDPSLCIHSHQWKYLIFRSWIVLCGMQHYYFPLESFHCRKFSVLTSLYHCSWWNICLSYWALSLIFCSFILLFLPFASTDFSSVQIQRIYLNGQILLLNVFVFWWGPWYYFGWKWVSLENKMWSR